jgi:nucleobase:cation symporter-1, NCS1 family
MVPFVASVPFTEAIARALGDADYSMFVGLPAAGLFYLLFCRSPDVKGRGESSTRKGSYP